MTTILLILTWALSLYAVATFCFHRGWQKGFQEGYADGCIRKYEEPEETANLTEEELFKIYEQKKNADRQNKNTPEKG